MTKDHVVAIIPARGGSIGIPNKNIVQLAGKPLVAWTIDQALGSKSINEVIVSTDSKEIATLASSWGAYIISRPKELSGAEASSEDAIIHALEIYSKKCNIKLSDIVVMFLQATSPLRKSDDIDLALLQFQKNNYDSLFSCSIVPDLTLWTFVEDKWESSNFDYRNRQMRQNSATQYVENGSIYIFRAKRLMREKNRLSGRIGSYVMEPWQVHEIDEPDDLNLVEYFINEKKLAE